MVVVVLTDCPPKLRGDLSKWFFEINTGVYVGNVSARVRERIWERICENIKHGQATMVYSATGEQKMEFCVHNTSWKIVDYDGIKLMQRPLPKQMKVEKENFFREGFSKVSQYSKIRRIQKVNNKALQTQNSYVVIDAFHRGKFPECPYIRIDYAQKRIVGYTTRNSGGVPFNFKNYFVIEFDKPFTYKAIVSDNNIDATQIEGRADHVGAIIGFSTQKGELVHARVASSFISEVLFFWRTSMSYLAFVAS